MCEELDKIKKPCAIEEEAREGKQMIQVEHLCAPAVARLTDCMIIFSPVKKKKNNMCSSFEQIVSRLLRRRNFTDK